MKYNLNNNEELINFLNYILQDNRLVSKAPDIIKFFIITRNYGFIDYKNNIIKILKNHDILDLCLETIKRGFTAQNIPYSNEKLIKLLITNYHDNGFYFHSFPGIFKDSILGNGILSHTRTELDDRYYEIIKKYHLGDYFLNSNNRVSVSEKIGNPYTVEYALLSPEWLNMFLKQGNHSINAIYALGDLEKLKPIVANSLNYFNEGMQRNPNYDRNDYIFLCKYIKDAVIKRFKKENTEVGIAFIEKKAASNYFGKYVNNNDINIFANYIKARNLDDKGIIDFIINSLSNGEKISERNIPKELISIVSYEVTDIKTEEHKAIK